MPMVSLPLAVIVKLLVTLLFLNDQTRDGTAERITSIRDIVILSFFIKLMKIISKKLNK